MNAPHATAQASLITEEIVDQVRALAFATSRKTNGAVEGDELFSVGECSLVASAGRWEARRGVEFRFYALKRAKYAMLDYLREIDPTPRRVRQQLKAIARRPGDAPHTEEDRTILAKRRVVVSVDAAENPAEFLNASLSGNGQGLRDTATMNTALMVPALLTLNPVEQFILWQSEVAGAPQDRIGAFLCVTYARISQIQKSALPKLRRAYINMNLQPEVVQ